MDLKEFIRSLIKTSIGHSSCEIKITNGAHSTVGKIITKLCTKALEERNSKATSSAKSHSYDYKSLKHDVEDNSVGVQEGDEDEEEADKSDCDKLLPLEKPFQREYILRSSVSRPAPYSRQSPQRLYCLMSNLEFRLAGAFTEDTMFF